MGNGGIIPDPSGIHTEPAGRGMPTFGPFSNQAVLALAADIVERLTPHQQKAVTVAQLEYSRDLSTRAAQAYQAILDIINP